MASDTILIKELKRKTIPIFKEYPVDKVILFGSYAKGDAAKSSDIDLFIDTNGKLRGLDFVGLIERLADALGVEIDLIDKMHIEPGSLIIQEIENKGVVLYEKSKNIIKNN
ncbi:nucleotidyltransferase family protein [Desulfitibacter alkalitolerans]|uniref:nucleotidyltransferase family protein n=1 Tax=Desulfitibacter alkalitolerans TaxID=264641 RepID=UPI000481AA1B|nr:nucleotidyltransferase domain-containing protein [Desulfitibacter alkalitolerans]